MAREKTAREMADGWRDVVSELRAALQLPTATAELHARFEASKEIWIGYEKLAMERTRATSRRARR